MSSNHQANLEPIVKAYISKIRPIAQTELDWFQQQPSLSSAVEKASYALNKRGKQYSHQWRLKKVNLEKGNQILQDNINLIAQCQDFDELFSLVERMILPIHGLGELYAYDTAFRIGTKLGLAPKKVYLHAGTREGARKLGLDHKAETIEMENIPAALQELEPHEIEDVLCIFKDRFDLDDPDDLLQRCWCG